MTPEYLVLGIVLILMGGVQIWLRHGPGSRPSGEDSGGGSGGPASTETGGPASTETGGAPERGERARREVPVSPSGGRIRSGRAWEAWTAILGFVGIAVGIALVVVGILGR